MKHLHHDGGRAAAGYKGRTGDCSCRAISIALELPYQEVYDALNGLAKQIEKRGKPAGRARTGVRMKVLHTFMEKRGWMWVATMGIGTGCKVHLTPAELPSGRLICRVSKHLVAVIDGVIHDTFDPSRDGTRCVYGYWRKS